MYKLIWSPDLNRGLNCTAFSIILTPAWQEAVRKSAMNQEKIDALIEGYGAIALKCHGYTADCYNPRTDIRIIWGENGIQYMRVPGNACELTLNERPIPYSINGEWALEPHNIDNLRQASLLLTMFLKIVEFMECEKL